MSGSITASTASSAASAAANARSGISADFNSFLRMLTTQLQNQDPTKAMDTNQMTQQLVAFAQVEQQITMNGNLDRLVSLQQTTQLTAAAPLIGKMVEVDSNQLSLQDGVARLRLPAAGPATQARIQVQDAYGRTLREAYAPLGTGQSTWRWDGKDANGRSLPDGAYNVVVTGIDSSGAAQPITASVIARATAAERQNGDLQLVMGGLSLGFDKVRSVDVAQ